MPFVKPEHLLALQIATARDLDAVDEYTGVDGNSVMEALRLNPVTGDDDVDGEVMYVNGVWVDLETVKETMPVKRPPTTPQGKEDDETEEIDVS